MARTNALAPLPCEKCGYLAPSSGLFKFCPACGDDMRTQSGALIGQVIADRYRLLNLVGEGGMGAVYKAEHIRMGKVLALKLLRGDFASDPVAVERFNSEARIVSRLSHPHTIAVFDFGELGEKQGLYLAMEYVPGKDLANLVKDMGKLPEARAARIGQQVLGSLAEAHEAGIVHRDMKPANVMLRQARPGEDFAKVLDFGIAKFLKDETGEISPGIVLGTPNYLAPEQARGQEVDARTDIYAVGCILYELCAGHPPFIGPSIKEVVSAHLHEEPMPLGQLAPGVSLRFAETVHRALEKDPGMRFSCADEMRDALLPPGGGVSLTMDLPAAHLTGELQIAKREDFREFEAQLEAMKRSRVLAPFLVVASLALLALLLVGWPSVYGFVARHLPAIALALPAALRPGSVYDGNEREPNNVPAQANVLPIPPGPQGQEAGGVAVMRGYIGSKISEDVGDVDVYRIEVPEGVLHRTLIAEWHGEKPGEGIRGLDVALSLNRERSNADPRSSAPLVATANRGGPGRPETLSAPVEPGIYYLAVREVHSPDTGPVEKPSDPYILEVRLVEPTKGQEVEPNDEPDRVASRYLRYFEWRDLALRNPLAEGETVHGDTSPEDWDTWAVLPGDGSSPELVVAIPAPDLGLGVRLWTPDARDLDPPSPPQDRVRWKGVGEEKRGEVMAVRLSTAPTREAPTLFALHAASGFGAYEILALGGSSGSATSVLKHLDSLAKDGRNPTALELAAAYAGQLSRSSPNSEVLLTAGALAKSLAEKLDPEGAALFAHAGRLLGEPLYRVEGRRVRYRGVFEARVGGTGREADEAALRLATLSDPCTPASVALRTSEFLKRRPASPPDLALEARLLRARALDESIFDAAPRERVLRVKTAIQGWRVLLSSGRYGREAKDRMKVLSGRSRGIERGGSVCP